MNIFLDSSFSITRFLTQVHHQALFRGRYSTTSQVAGLDLSHHIRLVEATVHPQSATTIVSSITIKCINQSAALTPKHQQTANHKTMTY